MRGGGTRDLQNEGSRVLAARRAGLPEDTPALIVSGLETAVEAWKEELGLHSTWTEADDLAFSLATHPSLKSAPEIQKRILYWIETTHPNTTGARRAEVLLEWLDVPGGRDTYMTWGGGVPR